MRYWYLIVAGVIASASIACAAAGVNRATDSGDAPIIEQPFEQGVEATSPPPTSNLAESAEAEPIPEQVVEESDPERSVGAGPVEVQLELVAEDFTSPVALAVADDGTNTLYIVEQNGRVEMIAPDGTSLGTFLDVNDEMVNLNPAYDERGLLGLAFHPDYVNNGRVFAYYSAPKSGPNHVGRISEFTAVDGVVDNETERVVLDVEQPFANHNGGQLSFGPDGLLYLGLGDGGGAGDPQANGQDVDTLLGGIIRIDVDAARPYAVPASNPFTDGTGASEIYAFGMRNPYRFSFDSLTGDLWVADVGQNVYEEVNIVEAGGNYGWPIREASSCFNEGNANQPLDACANTDAFGNSLLNPVLEYDHGIGISVIGGYVYRGDAINNLYGRYVFGDWNGSVFVGSPNGSQWSWEYMTINEQIGVGANILGFGEDENGELYILTSGRTSPTGRSGVVWRIVQ